MYIHIFAYSLITLYGCAANNRVTFSCFKTLNNNLNDNDVEMFCYTTSQNLYIHVLTSE